MVRYYRVLIVSRLSDFFVRVIKNVVLVNVRIVCRTRYVVGLIVYNKVCVSSEREGLR